LFEDVAYLETSGAAEVIPGRYDVQIRRAGTDEPVATSTGHDFAAGVTYTVFAVGSLTRGDIGITVASAAPRSAGAGARVSRSRAGYATN
jgi:hypothetical protein